ncbi:MAG: UGSC family (seleno)protein, partial [Reyranella sp.]
GFVEGVEAQSDSLGFEPAVVYVPHPIQNRTKAEIEAIADQAFEKVVAMLRSQ